MSSQEHAQNSSSAATNGGDAQASANNNESSSEDYFTLNPAPPFLPKYTNLVRDFISHHTTTSPPRPIVLVTSGGTTVPLENQTVRFIDNFSAGTRGATSAEYFIAHGYAVIFLHRQFSLLPYSRHYSHSTNCFLDFMAEEHDSVQGDETVEGGGPGKVVISDEFQKKMVRVLRQYQRAKREDTLLLLGFTSINEYLWCLRAIAGLMKPVGEGALFYLAAAVSDFFVPKDRMVEHKIQSGEEFNDPAVQGQGQAIPAAKMHDQSLVIDLDPVPKFLKRLVDGWAPSAMIVSFKLETDPSILTKKARHALKKYAHHLVIGNLLTTRKWEVVFVSQAEGEKWIRVPRMQRSKSKSGIEELVGKAAIGNQRDVVEKIKDGDGVDLDKVEEGEPIVEIEKLIIPEVKKLHQIFIAQKRKQRGETDA